MLFFSSQLRVDMDIENNKEQNEKQTVDNGVQQYGYRTSLHVQEIHRVLFPWKLKN